MLTLTFYRKQNGSTAPWTHIGQVQSEVIPPIGTIMFSTPTNSLGKVVLIEMPMNCSGAAVFIEY